MKKVFSFMLTLLLMTCSAFALSDESQEIIFRGIPWGVSIPEFLEQVSEDIKFDDFEEEYANDLRKYIYGSEILNFNEKVQRIGYAESNWEYKLDLQVAGYAVDCIEAIFAMKPDEEGLPTHDDEHTALVAANYWLDVDDAPAAFADLTEKLTGLYGEPAPFDSVPYKVYLVWRGENDTFVSLNLSYASVYINYVDLKGNDLFKIAEESIVSAKKAGTPTSTDGL